MDSREQEGRGNGQSTGDAAEQESSKRVPEADEECGQAAGASTDVPSDDRVKGKEEIDKLVCIACPGGPPAKERVYHEVT